MKKSIILSTVLCLGGAAIGILQAAYAATASSTFQVQATVNAVCKVIANGPYHFGVYDPTTNGTSGTANFTAQCTKGTTYTPYIVRTNNMTSGANTLSYDLYSDTPGGTSWAKTAASGTSHIADGTVKTFNVFGKIPSGQFVTTGTYAETVTASVDY